MSRTTITCLIDAPIEKVFSTVADISQFSKVIPDIVDIEYLTTQKIGKGTRFKETRLMKGKRATTELEVTEYIENQRVRLISDAGGTIWDTVFTVKPDNGQTQLSMVMEAKPYKLLSRLINPLIKGMIEKAIASDMDAVKVHCENGN